MQGVCTEVAGILEEVANHEEEDESPELPAPASAPARFSAAVKSAMVAARAAGVNPAAAQRRWVCLTLQPMKCRCLRNTDPKKKRQPVVLGLLVMTMASFWPGCLPKIVLGSRRHSFLRVMSLYQHQSRAFKLM